MSDEKELIARKRVLEIWNEHGGSQHGPRVETMTMPEARFFKDFIPALLAEALSAALERVEKAERQIEIWQKTGDQIAVQAISLDDRAEAAEARVASPAGALEKISRALDREISLHRCACPHPCEDYLVHPGPCGTRTGESFRNIKVISDAALASLPAPSAGAGDVQDGWLPIESAPVGHNEQEISIETPFEFQGGPAVAYDYGTGAALYLVWYEALGVGMFETTHWRPLPASPSREGGE